VASITWDSTTVLTLVVLALAAVLLWFLRTGDAQDAQRPGA
jgi:hypothetical protein